MDILEIGIRITISLQGLGEWLIGPMQFFTFLGREEFFILIAPVIIWCLDARLGLRLGIFLMLSGITNSIFKLALHGPRPYWYDTRVHAYATETSFGSPSAHAQNAVVVWGSLADWLGKKWAWVTAIIIILLIGLSRLYLGVHFVQDILLGWLIGSLLLWVILSWEERITDCFNRFNPPEQALLVLGISLVMLLLGALFRLGLVFWDLPEVWKQNASLAAPESAPIDPFALSGLTTYAGAFFGIALGGILLKAKGGLNAGGPIGKRAVRFLVGLVGIILIWFGLGEIFPSGESLLPLSLRYLRYTLVGLWITAMAPLLFIKIGLSTRELDP